MSKGIKTLKEREYTMMDYSPELRELVESAAASWQDFCGLPLEKKMRYAMKDGSTGYEYKDGSGPQGDRKENYDITTGHEPTEIDNQHPFINHAKEISRAMKDLALEFAGRVFEEYGILDPKKLAQEDSLELFIRFIGYPAGQEVMATSHTDNSGFTFHLFETDSGCQRLDRTTRQWIDMPVSQGRLVAFLAMQLQLLSKGELYALTHRVVANDRTRRVGRFAGVCFARLVRAPQYDKATNGRLQEFEPGFNYDMPFADFAKLFK